ncbi:MAG: Vibrio phage, partial [Bacteroidota bacterium]
KLSYGEYIDAIDAQKLEEETIKKYKDNNWIILNKAKAGGLGGNTSIWTFKKCKEEASKYKSRTVFRNNSTSAYYYAIKNNWLDEICRHMIKLPNATHLFWTFEKCKEEALKYTTNKDFVKYSAGAYISSLRNGWINEIRSHMIK